MKYFYSYYPTVYTEHKDLFFNLLSIKLSSTILKKLNKTVGIYANGEFIELLKKYEIELDFYENIENEIKSISSATLFSVCKLYSNIIQTEPFIQIDTDLFLFDNFNFNLLETSPISFYLVEKIDHTDSYHTYEGFKKTYLDTFNTLCKKFPGLVYENYTTPLTAYNCAIVGGVDWQVFPKLYEPIFNVIKNNKSFLESLGLSGAHGSAAISTGLEQHIITGHLNQMGYNLSNINFLSSGNSFSNIEQYNTYLCVQLLNKLSMNNLNSTTLNIKEFEGVMHLTGTKTVLSIRNFIYEILKFYDPAYINWLEQKFGKQYDFQHNIQ